MGNNILLGTNLLKTTVQLNVVRELYYLQLKIIMFFVYFQPSPDDGSSPNLSPITQGGGPQNPAANHLQGNMQMPRQQPPQPQVTMATKRYNSLHSTPYIAF